MLKAPDFASHPLDEFWAVGTSVYCAEGDEDILLCECVSEHTAQGIVAVLRYHHDIATWFSWTGPMPPKLTIVGK